MLAKRDDMICCCAVGGMPRTGMAEGRPTITQGALARAATGGSLHRSPWIEHRTLPDWRTGRACLRGPSCVEGAIRGGANGGGCTARTERTMPYQGRHAKTIAWADSESVQARLTGRQVTRDNCIYREQNVKSPLARACGRAARAAWPRIAGIRQLIDKKGFSGFSTPRAGPDPCERMRPTLAEYYSR